MRRWHVYVAAVVVAAGLATFGVVKAAYSSPVRSTISLHYAANGNLDGSANYQPGSTGFNLADVSSLKELDVLPDGVSGLVYLGLCSGATESFKATVGQLAHHPKLFGYYLVDEPTPSKCPAADLAAEADWIHATQPGVKTFVLVQNLASSRYPTFRNGYTPANTHIDLFGIDPYPCRSELHGCDWGMVQRYVSAATAAGIPRPSLVPVFQAFGGSGWTDDGGGRYTLPTADQTSHLLTVWQRVLPHPAFDFVYSWGVQRNDRSLATSKELQQVYAAYNRAD